MYETQSLQLGFNSNISGFPSAIYSHHRHSSFPYIEKPSDVTYIAS